MTSFAEGMIVRYLHYLYRLYQEDGTLKIAAVATVGRDGCVAWKCEKEQKISVGGTEIVLDACSVYACPRHNLMEGLLK